jgi:hypothetical protein
VLSKPEVFIKEEIPEYLREFFMSGKISHMINNQMIDLTQHLAASV